MYANIFVVRYGECGTIVGRSMDGRVKIKGVGQKGRIAIIRTCYSEQEFIASDFSSRVQNQDISRFGIKKYTYQAAY